MPHEAREGAGEGQPEAPRSVNVVNTAAAPQMGSRDTIAQALICL